MDYYDSSYGVYESSALSTGAVVANVIISLALTALAIIAYWRIFVKAGEEGWKAIIPFYNAYTAMKLFWKTSIFWIGIGLGVGASIGYGMASYGVVDQRSRVEVADVAAFLACVAGELHVDNGRSLRSDGLGESL